MTPSDDPVRFSVREITFVRMDEAGHVHCVTDTPCHLYLRWTSEPPRVHIVPTWRRGIAMHANPYFCFVAYHDNEQEEAGDTLEHNFHKPDWEIEEVRYFYFWGEKAGVPCISTTSFVKYQREDPDLTMYVKSLGKFTDANVLTGDVKLKEGANITIVKIEADNALEISATAAAAYEGFRNHWLKLDPQGHVVSTLGWRFDEVHFAVANAGDLGAVFSAAHRNWGLVSPHSCQFKITRGIAWGGVHGWFCIAKNNPDIHNNLNQEHIGFRLGTDDNIYCTNADGVNRTQSGTGIGAWPPKWVKWIRNVADIEFYVDGILRATHNTNLPTVTNSCFFTFELVATIAAIRDVLITCPIYGIN